MPKFGSISGPWPLPFRSHRFGPADRITLSTDWESKISNSTEKFWTSKNYIWSFFAKISKLRKKIRLKKLHLIIFAKLDVLGFDMWIAGFKTFNLKHVISIIWPEGYNYSCAIKTIKSNWKTQLLLSTKFLAKFSVFRHL